MDKKLLYEFFGRNSEYCIILREGKICIGGIYKGELTFLNGANPTPSELREIADFCEQQTKGEHDG